MRHIEVKIDTELMLGFDNHEIVGRKKGFQGLGRERFDQDSWLDSLNLGLNLENTEKSQKILIGIVLVLVNLYWWSCTDNQERIGTIKSLHFG